MNDAEPIASLMCLANADAIFAFSRLMETGASMAGIIVDMLSLNTGHARTDNAIVAEKNGDVIGMIFIFQARQWRYEMTGRSPVFTDALQLFFNPFCGEEEMVFIHSFAVQPALRKVFGMLTSSRRRGRGYSSAVSPLPLHFFMK